MKWFVVMSKKYCFVTWQGKVESNEFPISQMLPMMKLGAKEVEQ
jgi:hypothetical protein